MSRLVLHKMDIYCDQCEEPYEAYYVQHEMNDDERRDFLNGKHCPSCKDKPKENKPKSLKLQVQSIAMELMGDDLDGVSSTMEDFEYLNLF